MLKITCTIMLACGCANPAAQPDASSMPDATIDAPPGRRLVVVFGQSNAGNQGSAAELADPALAAAYGAVPYEGVLGNEGTTSTPIVSWPLGALGPRTNYKGVDGTMGVEVSLGRALDEARPGGWAIAKYSIGSSSLAGSWNPTGLYSPTYNGVNLFDQQVAYIRQALADTHATLGALVWIQGESDAAGATVPVAAQQYGVRLAEFFAAERWALGAPDAPIVYGRLNAKYPGAGTPDVRAGEEANQTSNQIMVDQDPYPLQADSTHYTTEGVVDLGRVYAAAVLHATR